jgi:hypothetical protein
LVREIRHPPDARQDPEIATTWIADYGVAVLRTNREDPVVAPVPRTQRQRRAGDARLEPGVARVTAGPLGDAAVLRHGAVRCPAAVDHVETSVRPDRVGHGDVCGTV